MDRFTAKPKKQQGFSLIELAIVTAIIAILAAVSVTVVNRLRTRARTAEGIRHVYQIKKAIDSWSKECGGYPIRTYGGGFTQLRRIIDRQPPTFPLGLPQKFPSTAMCDAVSLESFINSNMLRGTCDIVSDSGCVAQVAHASGGNIGALFVSHETGPGYAPDCSEDDGTIKLGWNYVLLGDLSNPQNRPVSVVCANLLFGGSSSTSSLTVVVNSGGVFGLQQISDGAGMVGPDGAALPDACPCGAWCEDHLRNEAGCCKSCMDATGVKHDSIPAMNIKY